MENTLTKIKEKSAKGIFLGLEAIKALCSELANPQDYFDCIHVAGTNGKGSVCAFCESILTNASIKVGCYTSPAVFDKTEQFRINGENISESDFINAAETVLKAVDIVNKSGINISEFEIETAIAFVIFKRMGCKICIIECGMGGLGDATNVIKNTLVAAFTPIDCEHQTYLGNSIYNIAKNKSGIIKNGCKVLSAQQSDEAMQAIFEACSEHGFKPGFVDNQNISITDINTNGTKFIFENKKYTAKLLGHHQAQNAALAIKICKELRACGYNIEDKHITNGIYNAKNNGRFEIIDKNPLVILDGAHNLHAAKALKNTLLSFGKAQPITIIMGVFADKNYHAILSEISKCSDTLIAVMPNNERALDHDTLCDTASKYFKYVSKGTISSAANHCKANKQNAYCICGSLSYLSDFKKIYLQIKENNNG